MPAHDDLKLQSLPELHLSSQTELRTFLDAATVASWNPANVQQEFELTKTKQQRILMTENPVYNTRTHGHYLLKLDSVEDLISSCGNVQNDASLLKC